MAREGGRPKARAAAESPDASFPAPRHAIAVLKARCAIAQQGSMLRTFPLNHATTQLSRCTWIDLIDPTDEERATVEKTFGLRAPTRDELGEIEATSRLQVEDGALYMTAPLILAAASEPWIPVPTGFVLAKHVLLTVR